MRVSICRPDELGSVEKARWTELQHLNPSWGSPFLSVHFTQAVGRARAGARVAVIEDDNRIVALFAYELRGLPGMATAIGLGISDAQALIHEAGFEIDERELLRRCGLAMWEFDHLVPTSAFETRRASGCSSSIVDVKGGFDHYLDSDGRRSSNFFKTYFRKLRKLGREVGDVRFVFGSADPAVLTTLIEWKSEQYRRTGRMDRFARNDIVQVVEEMSQTNEPDCRGNLSALYAGEVLVAGDFSIRSDSTLSCWFPAFDTALSKYSPGGLCALSMIEAARDAGLERLDLGKGEESYKVPFRTGELPLLSGHIARPTLMSTLRRAHQAPREKVLGFVMSHPKLRKVAGAALEKAGPARLAIERVIGTERL